MCFYPLNWKIKTWICAVLATLCILYGILVRSVGSGTLFFCVWICLGVAFFILTVLLQKDIFAKLPKPLLLLFKILVIAFILFFLVVESFIIKEFDDKGEDNLDAIIVLGAQVYKTGPSIVLQYRLDAAIEYLKDNPDTYCVVTGGQGSNEPYNEAEIMSSYLTNHGISENSIIKETESLNTRENLINADKLLDDNRIGKKNRTIGVVTNNFHLYRSLLLCEYLDINNVSGIAAGSSVIFLPNNLLREFMALVKFWMKSIVES